MGKQLTLFKDHGGIVLVLALRIMGAATCLS
jgi:hypothetical protein